MRLLLLLFLLVAPMSASAFSFETGGCASGGCAAGEQFEATNANEIDAALDALETTSSSHTSSISTINATLTSDVLLKTGGTMDNGSSITLLNSYIFVEDGGIIDPTGSGVVRATAMSATGQIDDNDLAAGSVDGGTGGEIADGSITAADLATSAVTSTDILDDTVALTTDTSGDYVATVTGDSEITVSGAGTEGRAATLAIAAAIARDTEVAAVSTASSTDNAIVRFDGTSGDVQDSLATVADTTGNITTPGSISAGGASGASTIVMRNMADSGWVECGVSGTTWTCATDADGTPDGTL